MASSGMFITRRMIVINRPVLSLPCAQCINMGVPFAGSVRARKAYSNKQWLDSSKLFDDVLNGTASQKKNKEKETKKSKAIAYFYHLRFTVV